VTPCSLGGADARESYGGCRSRMHAEESEAEQRAEAEATAVRERMEQVR
jgi:hypothetical protein